MSRQPRHNTSQHAQLPPTFLGRDDLTTGLSFDSKATWVTDVLSMLFWHVIHGCLYNQALADIRSTGAGIKCLYCICDVTGVWWNLRSGTRVAISHVIAWSGSTLSTQIKCLYCSCDITCDGIYTWAPGWQSKIPGLPAHLVQKSNVFTEAKIERMVWYWEMDITINRDRY